MLKTEEEIKKWLDKHEVTYYTINNDLTVDVNDNVYLNHKGLKRIPVQFNVVNGWFWISCNRLTLLIGSPKIVNGNFVCSVNQLTSLEGSPKEVNGWFDCFSNKLTSLKYLPEISGKLVCDKDLHETKEYKVYEINKKLKELA